MNIKLGNQGFYIRNLDKIHEFYDNKVIDLIYNGTCYGNIDTYKELIKDCVVLDLGSHIGCMAKKFFDCGAKKVICVEPNPDLIECLKNNFKDLDEDKILILQAAVNDSDNNVIFYKSNIDPSISTIVHDNIKERKSKLLYYNTTNKNIFLSQTFEEILVNCYSFHTLLKKYHPTVVKIDIQGAEWNILNKKMPDFVNLIIIEWHFNKKINLPKWINDYNILYTRECNGTKEMILQNVL